eukprot:TRINITY_DN76104_c0_g1_i1.p1 TRINITY_DN76104_c0_g1~~TRINITY_DN76104_c0_g1_i1.p1  ORF type:complete len:385 (-),score=112.10 TRINITY_DN76104_c0_g1_i1:424-1578(-)
MKALVLSLALLSGWCRGAALTAEPESAAADSDDAEQEEALSQDGSELLSEEDESIGGPLPALKTFMAPYDEKLESITHEADALKGKLTAFRDSSMARLARKRKDYRLRLHQANQENQQLAKSNERLDKEVIRLQRQVAKKTAHLQQLQDATRKSKADMELLARELEVVDEMVDKSIATAKAKVEEVIKVDAPVAELKAPTLARQEALEQARDPEEFQFLRSASAVGLDAMPSFNSKYKNDDEGKDEEEVLSGTAGERKVPAKELSMLSKSVSVKAPQSQADLADIEPASLVELLSRNLASLQKHEETSETALWEEFKKRVKQIFRQRRELRKREGALQATKKKLTKYAEELKVSTKKAEGVQHFLEGEINKESNYLRKVKKPSH